MTFVLFLIKKKTCHFRGRGSAAGERGRVLGGWLRAAQQVERGDSRAGAGSGRRAETRTRSCGQPRAPDAVLNHTRRPRRATLPAFRTP